MTTRTLTLGALAFAALASGAAFAADTQIYGVIDTGFSVRNNQYVNGNSDTTTRIDRKSVV